MSYFSLSLIQLYADIANTHRAFRDILKIDRETYGVGEDYEIGDIIADEWQQRVDDAVAGISTGV